MIERDFDIPFVSRMALREKQIQQNYRPVIAVHKWFARRPGTLFRSLLLAEFVGGPLKDVYFQSHNLKGLRIVDPFMGGGTPLLEANRVGCDVIGYDINPMACWIVRQEIQSLDVKAYREAAEELRRQLENLVRRYYRTTCLRCGSRDAHVKYFIWVKTYRCAKCGRDYDLFPGYLLAQNRRHPKYVIICAKCGWLNESKSRHVLGQCDVCHRPLKLVGPARNNKCTCPHCGTTNIYPAAAQGVPRHRMIAIEYYCPICKPQHQGRFFKKPDEEDLKRFAEAAAAWLSIRPSYVPNDTIPSGDESDRLHRWGYRYYREMFNERQLLGLELSCRLITQLNDQRIRDALATNLSDLLRYQNMLCRYDTMALKSLDIFSIHGFPVSLIQCESNLLGIRGEDGRSIGSGGWSNIIDKYALAKEYCDNPFETRDLNGRKVRVSTPGEWIGDSRNTTTPSDKRNVEIYCSSSTLANLPPASVDAVFTDPPYFANVQYAELIDFCYVWLRRLVQTDLFIRPTTRNENDLTGNATLERDLVHFTEGLSAVFGRMAKALKPGSPLVFTYHHNSIDAYYPIAVALLDAGLTCTVSLPCPAEMGASIHISGTRSSIIDTIFVCRSSGSVPRRLVVSTSFEVARLVQEDLDQLKRGGLKPTQGDARCIICGHLTRLAIWYARRNWQRNRPTTEKLRIVTEVIGALGGLEGVEKSLADLDQLPRYRDTRTCEERGVYVAGDHEIPF